ncbi:MAG: sulfatase-like hydrolase/transferase [Undibacterium sp.]|nr:sulfatase-like hydrolase/transferase [Opitutaceae bacterium]
MGVPLNILWIVTTQWRASACGYAGDRNTRTPNLDALAAQSVNYAEAVTPHPFGPFARAALLTGRRSPQNGVRDYFDALPTEARTIAHELGERGYATAFFGKWGVGRRDPRVPLVGEAAAKVIVPPEERGGFEVWDGFEGGFLLNDPWFHGTQSAEPQRVTGYQSDVVCSRASEWTRDAAGGDRPWFAMVSLEAPHPPYAAPAAGAPSRLPSEIILCGNVPRGGGVEAQARTELAGYYAHIEATDRAVGQLIDKVASRPLGAVRAGPEVPPLPQTVVVFTSVHGDMHGAHGLFRKGWPHEESVRVPLLVRAPGEAPRRENAAVSLADLPELMLAKIENRKSKIENNFARISMPSVVARPFQCDRVWRGVRTSTRKLVFNEDGTPWLFFDLENDPLEMTNLAGDPARAGEITALRDRDREK